MDKVLAELAELLRDMALDELLVARSLVLTAVYPRRRSPRRRWSYLTPGQGALVFGGVSLEGE